MIRWSAKKAERLKSERGIDIVEVAKMIDSQKYICSIEVPSQSAHPGQRMFIIKLQGYIHCVPFVIEEDGNIFIKTVYASRKFNSIYNKGE